MPKSGEPALRMEALSYRYPEAGVESLRSIDLDIPPGEFVVLAGRSASGKSTLLRAACGLVPHFHGGEISGIVEVGGLDVRDHGPGDLAAAVGYVAQDPETQVVSTMVAAELELPLEMRGVEPAGRARAVEEVALALAIPHLLPRSTATLSGGELQRVALAAALVTRPALVLLDEPTSQLDPVAGDELIWLLRRLNEEWGTAVVLCEHRLERCLAAADRTVAMAAGRIGFDGAPSDFLDWALANDPALATPGANLFDMAGIRPLPVGVKSARDRLASLNQAELPGVLPPRDQAPGPRVLSRGPQGARAFADAVSHPLGPPRATRGRGRSAHADKNSGALLVRDLWVELDRGEEIHDVLRGIDLGISAGERVALMGRNGAGKSTLLRTVAGILEAARGRVEAPGGCALLGQDPGDFLVRERVGDELPGDAGLAVLRQFGLETKVDADPRDLSGGERQLLALAIVVGGRAPGDGGLPGLICLDEPTRGMDRGHKRELSATVDSLCAAGSAAIVATHDVEFAAEFAGRVVLLGDGEVIADGSTAEILAGGWYFATEVARITGGAAVLPEQGVELIAPGTPSSRLAARGAQVEG